MKHDGFPEAYESPIIEQGSILLSAPNDHFCINQQYFHKTLVPIFHRVFKRGRKFFLGEDRQEHKDSSSFLP